jgi:Xaa-Pro aminopeptidase
MAETGASHHFISSLDDIAWLTNLRGSDISCTPLFMAHLLVDHSSANLFVSEASIDDDVRNTLQLDGIRIQPYEAAGAALAALDAGAAVLIDPRRVTLGLRRKIPEDIRVLHAINPTSLSKSRKTDAELEHIREAMAEDGAAMCEFYAWFEQALAEGQRVTELTVDEKMTEERARRNNFVSLSFPTIAGFNGNGAMPHYGATEESHAVIEGNGLLLIDSGAQYHGATTDITRVWPIGAIEPAIKRDYTMVLKAHLSLTRARFPVGTLSTMLDAVARMPMWHEGMDYAHGTGHGVGYFLCVHEGPQTIRQAIPEPQMAMHAGMVTSIEPALYRPGNWGVRIENLVANVPIETAEGNTFGEFLEFETLTLCPIDTRCIELSMLREDEKAWLNEYHARVRERLASRVGKRARDWLETRTRPL